MHQHERSSFLSRMMPWLAVFAFLPMSLTWVITSSLTMAFAPLTVPLAIFLGHHYGRSGVTVVLLAGLFMVPALELEYIWFFGAGFDLWIVAIFACHFAASERTLDQLLPAAPFSWAKLAVFLALPIGISVWGIDFGSEIELRFQISLTYIAFIFLFVAGLARSNTYHITALLAITMMIGLILTVLGWPYSAEDFFNAERAELPILGLTDLSYIYISYGSHRATWIFTGLAYFATGLVCSSIFRSSSRPPAVVCVGLLSAIAIMAAGVVPFDWLSTILERGLDDLIALFPVAEVAQTVDPYKITVTTSRLHFRAYSFPPLFPLLGFASALLFAYRGVIAVLAGMTILWIINALFRGYFPSMVIPYSHLLVMLGFAALGILLRNRLLSTTDRWWSKNWAVYLGIVVAVSVAEGVPISSVYFPIVLAIAIAVGLGAQCLRSWLHGRKVTENSGWVALLMVLWLPYVLWSSLGKMVDAIKQLAAAATVGPMLDHFDDQWWVIALLAIFALWVFLTAVKVFIATIPVCIADLRRLLAAVVALVTQTPLSRESEHIPAVKHEMRWWYPQALFGVLISGIKWTGIILALATFTRPMIDYIGELMEESTEKPSRTETPKVTVQEPDPYLLQAALEALALWSDLRQEADSRGVTIKTGWTNETAHPDERKRATVRIRYSRGKRYAATYAYVRVEIQRKSRGLWVESDDQYKRKRQASNELEAQLKQRATELAGQE